MAYGNKLQRIVALCFLTAACTTNLVHSESESEFRVVVTLDRTVHFTQPQGPEVVASPDIYRVDSIEKARLRLQSLNGPNNIVLQATVISHDETVSSATALSIPFGEDEHRLVLIFPDKTGLEAAGTYSGIQPRGGSFLPLTRFQINQALTAKPSSPQVQRMGSPSPPVLDSPQANHLQSIPQVVFRWHTEGGLPAPTHYELCVAEAGKSCSGAEAVNYRWQEDAQRIALPGLAGLSNSTGTPITGTQYQVLLPPRFQAKRLEWMVRACAPSTRTTILGSQTSELCTWSSPRSLTWTFTAPTLVKVISSQSPFRPSFDWSTVPAAESYLFCVSRPGVACPTQPTDTPQTLVISTNRFTTHYAPATDWELARFARSTVHWTAAACTASRSCTYQTSVNSITFPSSPGAITPVLLSPSGEALGRRHIFEWQRVPQAFTYKLCVAPPGVECGSSGAYEQAGIANPNEAKIIFPLTIPIWLAPQGTRKTLNWTVASCNQARQCVYQANIRTITLSTTPVIRMVVLGDSVAWGQGLAEPEKFYSLVEQGIRTTSGNLPIIKEVRAHSGAIIGMGRMDSAPPLTGEIPTDHPTVLQQVRAVPNPETVDLILLDGCINDVNIRNILNPGSGSLAVLRQKITQHCYQDMKSMLQEVGGRFSDARILVTGFYPIVSNETDLDGLAALLIGAGVAAVPTFLAALGLAPTPLALPALIAALVAAGNVKADIIERATVFHYESRKALDRATRETGAELASAGRFKFVDAGYGRLNAIFAKRTWLYGIHIPSLSPEDDGNGIAQSRRTACDRAPSSRGVDLLQCHRASLGHPNPKGAQQYANAINHALSGVNLNPAQP